MKKNLLIHSSTYQNTHQSTMSNTITGYIKSLRKHSKKLIFIDIIPLDSSNNDNLSTPPHPHPKIQLTLDFQHYQYKQDFSLLHSGLREGDLITAAISHINQRPIINHIELALIISHKHTLPLRTLMQTYGTTESKHVSRLYDQINRT